LEYFGNKNDAKVFVDIALASPTAELRPQINVSSMQLDEEEMKMTY